MSEQARVRRQAAKLRAALRERDARVQELEKRLVAIETSTTLQVGKLVAGAARQPGKGAVRLPKQLYRLWKKRNAPQYSATQRESGSRLQTEAIDRPEDRLLAAGPYEGLVVGGIFTRETAAALAGRAKVLPLYPHDATLVLDAADVDVLVVDAGAGAPGGPWAYLGVPGVYDREKALNGVLELAKYRGLPVVLWGDTPPATLTRLGWDAVVAPAAGLDAAVERLSQAVEAAADRPYEAADA